MSKSWTLILEFRGDLSQTSAVEPWARGVGHVSQRSGSPCIDLMGAKNIPAGDHKDGETWGNV